jgi:hypothetical protein
MIRPAPATQPWPESVNWTAASAGSWPDPAPDEAAVAGDAGDAALPVHDEADVGDTAVPGELAELGVDPVPADVLKAAPPVAAADPDDAAAQPAAEPATASTVSAEAAARRARALGAEGSNVWFARALKGISFVTFQMTLYPLARLYRVPSVRSWG